MPQPTFLDTCALPNYGTVVLYRLGVLKDAVLLKSVRNEILKFRTDPDPDRQEVGQRAAWTLLELQSLPDVRVTMDDEEPTAKHPDKDLLNRAQAATGRILTADDRVYRDALARGIDAIFVIDFSNRLQLMIPELPARFPPLREISPGEILTVRVKRKGKKDHEGIAYLEDHRKVVVNGGASYIGQVLEVQVISTIPQERSGQALIFAVPVADEQRAA